MLTTYGANLFTNNIFHTAASTPLPAKYYLGWSTEIPTTDGAGFTEPISSTGYSRIELQSLSNAVNGETHNSAILQFLESLADQGIAKAYGIFDSLTSGKLLIYSNLTKQKTIEEGTTFNIKPNELKITLKGE